MTLLFIFRGFILQSVISFWRSPWFMRACSSIYLPLHVPSLFSQLLLLRFQDSEHNALHRRDVKKILRNTGCSFHVFGNKVIRPFGLEFLHRDEKDFRSMQILLAGPSAAVAGCSECLNIWNLCKIRALCLHSELWRTATDEKERHIWMNLFLSIICDDAILENPYIQTPPSSSAQKQSTLSTNPAVNEPPYSILHKWND